MTKESDDNEVEVINDIFKELGIRKYQIITVFFVMVPTILNVMSNNTYVFTSRDTFYRCFITECEFSNTTYDQTWLQAAIPFDDGVADKCKRYVIDSESETINASGSLVCDAVAFDNKTTEKCAKWVYDKSETIVKSYDIPCQEWKLSLVQSVNSAGLLVSLLISGVLSDKYGRRTTMIVIMFIGGVLAIVQAFAPNYWMFVIFEFLNTGIGAGGYSIAYVLVAESLPSTKRIYGCALMEITNSLSIVAVGLLAWMTPSWKHLLIITNFPLLAVPVTVFIIPESLRWLYAKEKREKCVKLYKRAAELNGSKVSQKNLEELRNLNQSLATDKTDESDVRESLIHIFKSKCMLSRLLLCSFCWFASILCYDGLSINSVNVENDENPFLNFILVTLVELPSILLYLLLLKYFKRKAGLSVSFIGAGSLCLAYGASTEWNETLRFSMYLLGKLFINTSLASMYVYSSEMFPTIFRSFAMNFCYVFGCLGGMLTPQLLLLRKIHESLPMFIYGTTSILAAFFIFQLPETKGKKIPDSLEDAEQL